MTSSFNTREAGPAGRPLRPLRPLLSLRRIAAWSLLGSALIVLVALAARPRAIEDMDAAVDRVLSLYGNGDREGARMATAELETRHPDEPRVWLLLGLLAEDRGATAEAEKAYETALLHLGGDDPRRTDVEVTLADLLRRKGDPARALTAIDKLARERGETVRTRHARVLALVDLGRLEDALSETRVIAEERFGGGVARKLEKQIRSLMDAKAPRNG